MPSGWTTFPASSAAWSNTCLYNVTSRFLGCDIAERAALVDVYVSTRGNMWLTHTGWLTFTNPCNWIGVVCVANSSGSLQVLPCCRSRRGDDEGVHAVLSSPSHCGLRVLQVVGLALRSNALTGVLPSSIGSMSALTYAARERLFTTLSKAFISQGTRWTCLMDADCAGRWTYPTTALAVACQPLLQRWLASST